MLLSHCHKSPIAVRHEHTEYDALLAAGVERDLGRQRVAGKVQAILAAWRE